MDNNERMALLHEGIIFAETIGSAKCQMDTEDARFLYNLASRAGLVPQWQPIETAPKDGSLMDVWLGDCDESDRRFYCDGSSRRSPAWAWKGGKFRPCSGLPGIQTVFVQPTHWMPLPAPPKGGA